MKKSIKINIKINSRLRKLRAFALGTVSRAIALVAVGAIAMSGMSVSAQVNAEQVLNIGRNVLSMEDYMLSIQYFNQAIKAKPYLSDPYFFRALAKLYLEDYKGAEADCTLALERNKFKTESYKVRGFARQNMGMDSLAVIDYDSGLKYNPEDKYFLFYKAVAQTEMKKRDDAEATFDRLLRIYPQFEDGYAARGRLRAIDGDTVGALADLDKAISISKNLINAYLMRAQIEADQKKWDAALADMDAAIRLQPQEADLYVNRAYLRYNLDDYFGAMSDYNYTLELEPYNSAALFNRALLRYEVKDLNRAAEDFSKVLGYDPDNFHARYNLGLVNMERGHNKEALADFEKISRKYPRFYPVYYAKAEVYRNMGDMRTAMQNAYVGDDLVRRYVSNPEKNPLDRPTIAPGKTRTDRNTAEDDESEIEVMNRFNQLVTVGGATEQQQLTYNEKIKGRVQDRDIRVEPEPAYMLSLQDSPLSLRSTSNYFRELDDFNQRGYISDKVYLSTGVDTAEESVIKRLFDRADFYEGVVADGKARPADRFVLGVIRSMLKNYPAAIESLNVAIEGDPGFTMAYMARAYARYANIKAQQASATDEDAAALALRQRQSQRELSDVMADYDAALKLNPRLVFAWFNKGNIYYEMGDYTSALQCYSEAIRLDPMFGSAYFNRGITYLQIGNKRLAFSDLSKAGELGILPSYNLLKRMK